MNDVDEHDRCRSTAPLRTIVNRLPNDQIIQLLN